MQYERSRYVLGLDIATSTGWAVMEDGVIIHSGTLDMSLKPHNRRGDRLVKFFNFLSSKEHGPFEEVSLGELIGAVVYEDVTPSSGGGGFHKSQSANKLYFNMQGIVEMFATQLRIAEEKIHPSTLKKAFTGNGRATKEDIGRAAEEIGWTGAKWQNHPQKGLILLNDDEADAIALCAIYGAKNGFKVVFPSPYGESLTEETY